MRIITFLALAAIGSISASHAEDTPTITISKSDTVAVAVSAFTGAEGPAATKILTNDLNLSGHFTVAASGAAGFTITASVGSGSLEGKVTDAAGRTVLSKTFSGSTRGKVHAFADDIVETITGSKGIASTKIAFVSNKTGRKEIYTADYDGAGVTQLTRDNAISVGPGISADGSKLAYTGYQSGYADIYLIDLRSGSRNRIVKFPGTNTGAAFSPDGGRLALTASKDGNPELYVAGSGGGGAKRLTRTRGVESSPTWSPDGSQIIYTSDDRGSPALYRISSGGGNGSALSTGSSYCTEPDWSPDGKKVAYTVGSSGTQVAVLNLDGGGSRIVGSGQGPVWGRNSRHLLFAEGSSLILLDTRSGKRTAVISGLGNLSEPTWSR